MSVPALVPPPRDDDADEVPNETDNCVSVYNPSQRDGDSDGSGDACDLTIIEPSVEGILDCRPGAQPPTIRWSNSQSDRFKVFMSWDPAFARRTRLTSGETLLKRTFWIVPHKLWRKACNNADDALYFKVVGVDDALAKANPSRRETSEVLLVSIGR